VWRKIPSHRHKFREIFVLNDAVTEKSDIERGEVALWANFIDVKGEDERLRRKRKFFFVLVSLFDVFVLFLSAKGKGEIKHKTFISLSQHEDGKRD
jgi:hypothetical protein